MKNPKSPSSKKLILQLHPEQNLKEIAPFGLLSEGSGFVEMQQHKSSSDSMLPVIHGQENSDVASTLTQDTSSVDSNGLREKTSWLRIDVISSSLEKDDKPIDFLVYNVEIGVGSSARVKLYQEDLLVPELANWIIVLIIYGCLG